MLALSIMRITGQQFIIEDILEALETSSYGIGIREVCHIESELNGDNSYIQFTPIAGHHIAPADWFWLGYNIR